MAKLQQSKNILEVIRDVVQYKASCEANIVGCLWKQPDLYDTYDNLKKDDFSKEIWKMYFDIGKDIYQGENKKVLDDLTVGLYLEKHDDKKEIYQNHGGYKTISELVGFVNLDNIEGYIEELKKWQTVLELHKLNFPIEKIIDKIKEMSIEELYNFYEAQINHVFMNTDSGSTKSHNLCEGIHDLIDECNKGLSVGFPLRASMLNEEINGMSKGNIIIHSAMSGAGKTTSTIEWIIPNMIEYDEKVVMVINEQDEKKLRQELVVWCMNNIFNADFNKKRLQQGSFTEDEMKLLRKTADWIEEKQDNKNITIIPLKNYTVNTMIKIIKKYSALGVDYFILDTFKESDDASGESWKSMMLDMRKLYDVIKPANKNVALFVTVQLTKGLNNKYLHSGNIGMSKNIIDVASVLLLMRRVRETEKDKDKGLKVYKTVGKSGRTKKPVILDENKNYVLIFIDKNRFGEAQSYQIVAEFDMGKNIYKEVGHTVMSEDF